MGKFKLFLEVNIIKSSIKLQICHLFEKNIKRKLCSYDHQRYAFIGKTKQKIAGGGQYQLQCLSETNSHHPKIRDVYAQE